MQPTKRAAALILRWLFIRGIYNIAANSLELNPDIRTHITSQTPPTFLLQTEDDHVDRVEDSLSCYAALKKAGVPVEMHLYAQGGHAFGLRRTKFPRNRMASVGGHLAEDDRDDFAVAALASHEAALSPVTG